jgi:hypothetical protein
MHLHIFKRHSTDLFVGFMGIKLPVPLSSCPSPFFFSHRNRKKQIMNNDKKVFESIWFQVFFFFFFVFECMFRVQGLGSRNLYGFLLWISSLASSL